MTKEEIEQTLGFTINEEAMKKRMRSYKILRNGGTIVYNCFECLFLRDCALNNPDFKIKLCRFV
ncbi:MAG: hypothetical protein DDT40_01291 [candidate division WS2 bacterium]|nr:hypothetical protein [Candidatus Psychracetigena formicireducens]